MRLAQLLADTRRVALVGLAKNTGKTETLAAIIASPTARTSAAALGPATSTMPGSENLAITTSPSGVLIPVCSRRWWRAGLARSSGPVLATRLPAASLTRGLEMRASITSCSSPSRPIEVTPTARPAAAVSATIAASVSVLPVFLARPTSATRRVSASSCARRTAVVLALRGRRVHGRVLLGRTRLVQARDELAHDEAG